MIIARLPYLNCSAYSNMYYMNIYWLAYCWHYLQHGFIYYHNIILVHCADGYDYLLP